MSWMVFFVSGLVGGLWVWIAWQDMAHREIYPFSLYALALLCLIGQPWYWWALTLLVLAFPFPLEGNRQPILALVPVIVFAGIAGGPDGMPVSLALSGSVIAWALYWWESGDVVVLVALALRYGLPGLIVGTAVVSLSGLVLMVVRGRSLGLLRAIVTSMFVERRLPSLAGEREGEGAIPDDAEMPAAAVMAFCGLGLEVVRWFSLLQSMGHGWI